MLGPSAASNTIPISASLITQIFSWLTTRAELRMHAPLSRTITDVKSDV